MAVVIVAVVVAVGRASGLCFISRTPGFCKDFRLLLLIKEEDDVNEEEEEEEEEAAG